MSKELEQWAKDKGIKPLEWIEDKYQILNATTPWCSYEIPTHGLAWYYSCPDKNGYGHSENLEQAKVAAWHHWLEGIKPIFEE